MKKSSGVTQIQVVSILCLVFFFALFAFLIGPEGSERDDLLIFGRGGDAVTLDPSHATDGETFYATTQVYDTLVQFKYGTTEIEPALATSWTSTPDGLQYTFTLRKGVKFHKTPYFPQGAVFTAEDVIFSLKRQFDPNHPYAKIGGNYKYWLSMDMDSIVKDIVKVDDYTIRFLLKKPEAPFVANLAMNFSSILCKTYADQLLQKNKTEDLERYPVGTGPFIFVKWIKDDRIIFQANPDYWDGTPRIKWLILKVINNNSARTAALRSGQIHIMDFPNPEEVPMLERDPQIKIIRQEGLNVGYLAMNTEKKPFDNVLVRKAIYHAINKKAIVEAVFAGLGKPAKNPIPPTIWSYDEKFQDYEYNPQKARELLAQAGLKDGFSTELWAMPVPRPYMPDGRRFAEAIQADLAKVNIQVKIVSFDWGTYLDKVSNGEHSMAILGWTGDNGDPDNFMYVLLSSAGAKKPDANNIAFFRNPAFDALVEKAKITSDVAERTRLYLAAQKIFHQEVPWLPLAHSLVVVPVNRRVEGFQIDPVGSRRFHKVWLKKATEK